MDGVSKWAIDAVEENIPFALVRADVGSGTLIRGVAKEWLDAQTVLTAPI